MKKKYAISFLFMGMYCAFAQTHTDTKGFKNWWNSLVHGNIDRSFEKKMDMSFIVSPSYTREGSFGVGGVATALYRLDRTDSVMQPSDLSLSGNVSVNGFYSLALKGNNHFKGNKTRLSYRLTFQHKNLDFWGISYKACAVNPMSEYTKRMVKWESDYIYKVTDAFHVGAALNINYTDAPHIIDATYLEGQKHSYFFTGMGVSISYDTRDFILNPKRGVYFMIREVVYPSFLSSHDKSLSATTVIFDTYRRMWKDSVLAFDLYGQFNSTNTTWTLCEELGSGASRMQGYYAGRYIDRNQIAAQLELRQQIYGHIGCVAWVGGETVFPSLDKLRLKTFCPITVWVCGLNLSTMLEKIRQGLFSVCRSILNVTYMLKRIFFIRICCMTSSMSCQSQVITDSLANDFRAFAAKNFSRYCTVNLFWETKWAHDYTFCLDGKNVEKMRKKNLHTIKFSTMVPILKLKNASLYSHLQYSRYQFKTYSKYDGRPSSVFLTDKYDYFAGGLNGSYYITLFNKPFVLSASASVDAWNNGWGKVFGSASAIMVLKNSEKTSFSAGIIGMTLFSSMPVMPIITYWHRFNNPDLSVDIIMPSQFYLRYQIKKQRISVGAFMSSDNFYLKTDLEGVPEICYYSDAVLKPEIHYEYIINKHIYLSVHTGVSMVMKGGLYKKNRKGIKVKNEEGKNEVEPLVKQDRSPIPFFNVGISYSLFK